MAATTEMAVMFGPAGVAVVLFVNEAIPVDTTATGIVAAPVALGDYTQVVPDGSVLGFSRSHARRATRSRYTRVGRRWNRSVILLNW